MEIAEPLIQLVKINLQQLFEAGLADETNVKGKHRPTQEALAYIPGGGLSPTHALFGMEGWLRELHCSEFFARK